MLKELLVGIASFVATNALAVDFSKANELFKTRDGSTANINAAREAYRQLLPQTNSSEKLFAVEQMSRLSFYQGLLEARPDDKIEASNICLRDIENIVKVDGKTPVVYYYWKAICLIGWAKTNGIGASLSRSQEIANLIDQVVATDAVYEGGGGYRLASALYMALPPFNPFGPIGSLSKAMKYSDLALKSPAYAQEPDPETATGDYFFKVYEARAQIQYKQGDRQGALKTIQDALDRIDSGDVPTGREPETKLDRRDLQILLDEYQSF